MDADDGVTINDDVLADVETSESKSFFTLLYSIVGIMEANGWFILLGALIIYYIYTKLREKFANSNQTSYFNSTSKEDDNEAELQRLRNIELARQRQQAEFDKAKEKYLEEKRLKEERLAKQKIEEYEKLQQGMSTKTNVKKSTLDDLENMGLSAPNVSKQKPRLRPNDFNPLIGPTGGSCSYRPSRNSGAKKSG